MSWADLGQRLKEKTVKRYGQRCWPFLGYRDKDGNGRIWVDKKVGAITTQHAIKVLELGQIPEGFMPLACPILKDCVNPDHISLATPEEVIDRMIWKKRQKRRRKPTPHVAKLSDEQIRQIFLSTDSSYEIAKEFGISPGYVRHIRARKKCRAQTEGLERGNSFVRSESSGRLSDGDDTSYCGYGYIEYES